MKRKITCIVMFLAAMSLAFSATKNYETIKSYQIGTGTHYTYVEEKSVPWAIHVMTIDLTDPYTKLESVKAGDNILGRAGVSSMCKLKDSTNHRIVGAINADFYNTSNGQAINNQVVNGEFVRGFSASRSVFAYSDEGKAEVMIPRFSGIVVSKNDTTGSMESHALTNVNMDRLENYLIIYNSFKGESTEANQWGFECLARPISDWLVNDTVYCVIEKQESYVGNMAIPEGKFVLSGHGTGYTFLQKFCRVGDTVKVVQKMQSNMNSISQLVGGGPKLLENGVSVVSNYASEGVESSFCSARHPRTAVGYNEDSTKVVYIVVDGRQDHSAGMSLYELADYMKTLGMKFATNLDGGGSSTFVVRNNVKNIPSDNWERWVANGLMCVSSAPDESLSLVQIEKDSVSLYKKSSVELPMSGWDMYYNPKEITDWSQVTISYPDALGNFSDGVFTTSEADADGEFIAQLGASADTVKIHIIQIDSLDIYPDVVVTDTQRVIPLHVKGAEDGKNVYEMDMDIFSLEVLDPNIGTIDAAGVFTPVHSGETQVVVSYGDVTDTTVIKVEKGQGEVSYREMESLSDWSLEGENLTAASVLSTESREAGSGVNCLVADYTTSGSGEIHLTDLNPAPMFGIPAEILLDVESDGLRHKLYIVCEDALGIEYKYKMSGYLDYAGEFRTASIGTETPIPTTGNEYYPMTVKYILFDLKSGDQNGQIKVDRLRLVYPGWTSIEQEDPTILPTEFSLEQNYPNPFNPSTKIKYQVRENASIELCIYNIAGSRVETLFQGNQVPGVYTLTFDASRFPAGIYYYRLTADSYSETRKMLLIK